MLRMMRLTPPPAKLGILLTGTVCLALLATDAAAQPTREPEVVGAAGTVSPIVVSLDRSLTFYQGTLGLKSDAIREASAKETPPPLILTLEGPPEGRMRWSHVTFPGTMWWAEPLEFGDVERKAAQPRIQDPGAVTLIFAVRDLDSILAKVKKAGTPVVTPGGLPVRVEAGGTKGRAILVKDPDDHFIELIQPDTVPTSAPPNDLIDGHVRITIADTDRTMRLYRDLLGFRPQVGAFGASEGLSALTGLSRAQFRLTTASVPGEPRLTLEFLEVKGAERQSRRTNIQDPGVTRLQFYVRDLDVAVAHFKNAGGEVISIGGKPVTLPNFPKSIIVRDLNNFFIILTEKKAPKA